MTITTNVVLQFDTDNDPETAIQEMVDCINKNIVWMQGNPGLFTNDEFKDYEIKEEEE